MSPTGRGDRANVRPAEQPTRSGTVADGLATLILTREVEGEAGIEGLVAAMESSCRKFGRTIARLVTESGYLALLERALVLTSASCPELSVVRVGPINDGCLMELRQIGLTDPATLQRALTSILAALLRLLITFVGEDLTKRLVHDAWPDIPPFGTNGERPQP